MVTSWSQVGLVFGLDLCLSPQIKTQTQTKRGGLGLDQPEHGCLFCSVKTQLQKVETALKIKE